MQQGVVPLVALLGGTDSTTSAQQTKCARVSMVEAFCLYTRKKSSTPTARTATTSSCNSVSRTNPAMVLIAGIYATSAIFCECVCKI
ncbi:hypothetical protein PsorP6_000609 [Peronosclerospora sorghi]|uniref:Uncharacterized protein n=1 Tax=Peronosclerospora sorghi TaxID=230839 RepID=A0ACC0WTY4_9STRA|nr:hypothetical protein PsorP6_000609 [Peronosclerospora sorghi]